MKTMLDHPDACACSSCEDADDLDFPRFSPDWQRVLVDGFFPLMPTAGLQALAQALRENDPELLQEQTTSGDYLGSPEGACMIAYPFWKSDGIETVVELNFAFARA